MRIRTLSIEIYIIVIYFDLEAPFLLVLSACKLNDSNEGEKIFQIGYEIDTLLFSTAITGCLR